MLLVQYLFCSYFCTFHYCFNTLYVVGSTFPALSLNTTSFVSIHYMLLVQPIYILVSDNPEEFQYIICCWFKRCELITLYISCQGFNTLYVVGSTNPTTSSSNLLSVSIHYMLLVQFRFSSWAKC